MSKNKMSKDIVPQDFTLSLVLVDALPVLFFAGSMIRIGMLFSSPVFIISAVLCFYAGAAKVLWKLIVVCRKKNIWWMFLQMRYVMPLGFLGMIASLVINRRRLNLAAVFGALTSFPAVIFFLVGILGMCLMLYFAFHLDSSDLKSNWIEQLTNGLAQACFFIGLMLI